MLGMEETCLDLVKGALKEPSADFVLSGERLNAPPQDQDRARSCARTPLHKHCAGTPSHHPKARKRHETHTDW